MAHDRPEPGARGGAHRLVVVGAGPKALFALETLTARLQGQPRGGRLEVTVVDPAERAGTGAAYDPTQPPHLRLNVAAHILDEPMTGDGLSFPDWMRSTHPDPREEPFPPRALVGLYLHQRWQRMRATLERHARYRHVRGWVLALNRQDGRWRLEVSPSWGRARTDRAAGAAHSPREGLLTVGPVDEVLLATGHSCGHAGELAAAWDCALPLRPAVLPVEAMLSPEKVPTGARAAVRGAALTFLDAALTLTEARGATFSPHPGRPGLLVHRRGHQEPSTILPTSRHGLLLDAKPDPDAPLSARTQHALERARRELSASADPTGALSPQRALEIVVTTAVAMLGETSTGGTGDKPLAAGTSHATTRRAVEHTLTTGAEPDLLPEPGRAEQALRRSVLVAQGTRPPGPAWTLGRSWALLYPQITAGLRASAVPEQQWRRFRDAAFVLERFAFGPPLASARKLLAMIESGAVDLSWLDAGTTITPQGPQKMPHGSAGADVVIDAVLPPPGVQSVTDPLTRHLRHSGLITVRPGRRGAIVDPDGTAITTAGTRAEGLALIGRATEDHIIGHDTLNRHLHTEIDQWATRVTARVAGLPQLPQIPGDTKAATCAAGTDDASS